MNYWICALCWLLYKKGLGTRRGWVVSTTPRSLYPVKDPVTQGQSGHVKNLAPTGIRSPDLPNRSQLLYWLSYPAHQKIGVLKQYFNLAWGKNFCPFTQLPSDKTLSVMYRSVLHLLANEWAYFYVIILRSNVDSISLLYPFNSFYVAQHPVFGTKRHGRVVWGSNYIL
jgi:hypothetical protein